MHRLYFKFSEGELARVLNMRLFFLLQLTGALLEDH